MADLHSTAISQYIDFKIWLRDFHYLRGTSLSFLSELASIYTYPQSLLSNNKSQIHQPPCQASHPWATEHSPARLQTWNSLKWPVLLKSPELYKFFLESCLLLKFVSNI